MTVEMRINPIDCVAHGICAELLPEWVELDEWGYPVVDAQPLPAQLVKKAKRTATACPARAIVLTSR
jgi:ferredoxin